MGWTSYHATYYEGEKVDRKKECDAYFTEGLNKGYYKIIRSSMVGNVYYAAIQHLNDEEKSIFGVVILTRTNINNYYNFTYKVMDETVGPCYYDCPVKILKSLSKTDNELALNWRKRCLENVKSKNKLYSLKPGSIIKITPRKEYSKKEEVLLKKKEYSKGDYWTDGTYRWTYKMIQNYKIIKEI